MGTLVFQFKYQPYYKETFQEVTMDICGDLKKNQKMSTNEITLQETQSTKESYC